MRNAFCASFCEAALADPKIYLVVADISPPGIAEFVSRFPERYINVGIAEQAMIGVAAGLALQGKRPFVHTIAAFSLYRPFEMVRDDLAYQNLPVTVVGMGAGIIYSNLGATHHTLEDVAVASALPNMQVISPCDPLECIEATRWCAEKSQSPVYLRIGRTGEPVLTADADPWCFGKIRYLRHGIEVCIMTFGAITNMASQVADRLTERGMSTSLVSVHTLKPIDIAGIADALFKHRQIIVIEEHVPQGGLASHVKQIAWDVQATCRLHTFTLQDKFVHGYGTWEELLSLHGISVGHILARID